MGDFWSDKIDILFFLVDFGVAFPRICGFSVGVVFLYTPGNGNGCLAWLARHEDVDYPAILETLFIVTFGSLTCEV